MKENTSGDRPPQEGVPPPDNRTTEEPEGSSSDDAHVPEGWVLLDPDKEMALINRLKRRGSFREYWRQTSARHSRFEGYLAPAQIVAEERPRLEQERTQPLSEGKLEAEELTVYEVGDWQQEGVRESRLGIIPIPEGWALLESGDALLTRRVKGRGKHWDYYRVLKTKSYDRKLGVFAPVSIIEVERAKVSHERGTKEYQQRLQRSQKSRQKKDDEYTREFAEACHQFLGFHHDHDELAWDIAWGAASVATDVGSGRVGRTTKLLIEKKAELAVRAYIRHNFTDYDERLIELGDPWYEEIRGDVAREVNAFLHKHRPSTNGLGS